MFNNLAFLATVSLIVLCDLYSHGILDLMKVFHQWLKLS